MGKERTNTQKKFDEILRSILSPQAYSGEIIGNTQALRTVSYDVPNGLTEQQAMLVVLGAMLDEDVLMHTASASSAGSDRQMDWLQKFLIRDYLTGDEGRGYMFGEAMLQGRHNAKAALEAFSRGDSTKVNAMLSRASNVINRIYSQAEITDSRLWDSVAASMRLLREAAGNPKLDKVMGLPQNACEEKSAFDAMNARGEELAEQLKNPELPQQDKVQLTMEAMVLKAITANYNEDMHAGIRASQNLFLSVENESDYFKPEQVEGCLKVAHKTSNKYLQTHPSMLIEYMKTEEGRKEVFRQYAEKIKMLPEFQTAVQSGDISQWKGCRVELPDFISEKQRGMLESEWKAFEQSYQTEFRTEFEKAQASDAELKNKLNGIAEKNGIHNPTVLTGELIEERVESLGNHVRNQKELYLVNDTFDKIVRLYSADGENFTAKPVDALPPVYASGTFSKMHMQLNETLPLLHRSLTLEKELEQLPKENGFDELHTEFTKLTALMKKGLGKYSDSLKEQIAQQAAILTEKAGSIAKTDAVAAPILGSIQKFGNDVIAGQTRAQQRLTEVEKARNESIERAKSIDEKKRTEAIEKQIEITDQRRKREERAMGKGAGNRNTEVKNGLKVYLDAIHAKIANDEALGSKFVDFVGALDQLNQMTDRLYQRNQDGKYPPFSKENQKELLELYNGAIVEYKKLKTEMGEGNELQELREITGSVNKMLETDVTSLTGIAANNQMSLAEMIDKGRTTRVDIEGKNFSTVGAKSNVRTAMTVMKDGKEIKGFFTKEKKYVLGEEERKKVAELFAPLRDGNPLIAPLVDIAINRLFEQKNFSGASEISYQMKALLNENPNLIPENQRDKANAIIRQMHIYDYENSENASIRECEQLLTELYNLNFQYGTGLMATGNSSITGRNVAMSKVANLLNVSDIIANSEMMEQVDEKGNIIKGVFMANAKGIDHDKIMPDDVINCTEKCGDNPALLKNVAELQMLDFICQNIDRHQNNFFYQFNEDKSQLIGIQGIDNDLSFGTRVVPDVTNDIGASEIPLGGIKVITEKMGRRLLAMDESMLKLSLRETGLSEAEMQAAADRLSRVKTAIKEKRIEIVPDDKWKNYTLDELANQAETNSLFKMVNKEVKKIQQTAQNNLENKIAAEEEERLNPEQNKKPFRFEKVDALDGINKASMRKDAEQSAAFAIKMEMSQKKIWGKGSPEFRDLTDAMREYHNFVKNMGDNPSSPDYLKAQAMLEGISAKAQRYIVTKEGKKLDKNGEERFKIVKGIKAFADKRLPEYKRALHRKDEIEVEEMNARLKADATKKVKADCKKKCAEFGEKVLNDGSVLADFAQDVVKVGYEAIGKMVDRGHLIPSEVEAAKEHLVDIIAFDMMKAEREMTRQSGKTGMGPIEKKFMLESGENKCYGGSLKEEIKSNPTFQKAMENLTPATLSELILEGPHKLMVKMAKTAQKEAELKEPVLKKEVPQRVVQIEKQRNGPNFGN